MANDRKIKNEMVSSAKSVVGNVRGLKWIGYGWTDGKLSRVHGTCRKCGAYVTLSVEEAKSYSGHCR